MADYLVCQRPAHKRHGSLWEFPGGKVEAGETHFEAARRELAEELDVRVLSVGSAIFSIADPGSEFLIEFVPTTIDGSPKCLEHMDLKWSLYCTICHRWSWRQAIADLSISFAHRSRSGCRRSRRDFTSSS